MSDTKHSHEIRLLTFPRWLTCGPISSNGHVTSSAKLKNILEYSPPFFILLVLSSSCSSTLVRSSSAAAMICSILAPSREVYEYSTTFCKPLSDEYKRRACTDHTPHHKFNSEHLQSESYRT